MKIKSKKIVVVGSSNTDMVIRCKRMPKPGETILGGEFMMNQGGKGANQAVAAAKLDADVTLIAKLGNDIFGKETLSQLDKVGVNTSNVIISSEYPSGVALINVDETGENSISVASGANGALLPSDIDEAAETIKEAGILLMQLETPIETITRAAEIAKANGVVVVLNPAPAPANPLPAELLKNVDIIIPNKTEAELISGIEIENPELELVAVKAIAAKGVPTIIITLGSKGALLCQNDSCERIEPFKVKAIDTTAAGDTFCGAFCSALADGETMIKALNYATCAAAISVTRSGAQQSCPTRSEVKALFSTRAI